MAACMSSILALSVSDKIEQYGAYAGFASVLGLAVLSLLYFAQARELKRLREWAGRAPERALDEQQRAVAAAQQRVIAQPQRPAQPAPQQQPGQPAAAPGAPGARPAAATPAGQAAGAPGVAPAAAAAAATAAGAATATPPGAARPAVGGSGSPGSPNGPAAQPTTVQPAANGAAAADQPTQPPVRPGQPLRVPPGAGAPPPSRTASAYDDEDEPRSRKALFAAIGALVAVVAVVVILVTGVLGGSDNPTQKPNTIANSSSSAQGAGATKKKAPATPTAAPQPGTYTVAVLNGTTVPGLARGVANRLTEAKHKIGNVTNAATQDRSATQIEYARGHRAEADAVAKVIDVGQDAIVPLTAGSKTIAGDQATVVVTVGADQNTSPQQQTTTP
jgi:LytR cell envelope-related transcriptional attenuator